MFPAAPNGKLPATGAVFVKVPPERISGPPPVIEPFARMSAFVPVNVRE